MDEEKRIEEGTEEKAAREEKSAQDVKRWKEVLSASPDSASRELNAMPHEVVEVLVNDPEVGPALRSAISGTLPEAKETAESVLEYVEAAGTGQGDAAAPWCALERAGQGQHKESAAATAIRARKEREDREQKEEQARRLSLLARIIKLDVGERAKLARSGDKDCRSILIKDGNKQVAMAVLANPKINIQEIEMIAASRSVNEDVLREVGGNKDWCKNYGVILALVNNPKTPVGVSLTHLPKVFTRDLRMLARSKGVPEAIRVSAKRLAQKRSF